MAFVSAPVFFRSAQTLHSSLQSNRALGFAVKWKCCASASSSTSLKKELITKLETLDFGRKVAKSVAEQKKIEEEIQELERLNPTPNPVYDAKLDGKWLTLYSTSKSLLGISRPKPLRPNYMLQEIDSSNNRVQNTEKLFLGPFPLTASVEAVITDTTPTRVTVRFLKFIFLGLVSIKVRDDGRFTGWQDITYLDNDLRISRGNEGNIFVLQREKE